MRAQTQACVVLLLLSLSSVVNVSLSFLSSPHFSLTPFSVNSLQLLLSFAALLHSPPNLSRSLLTQFSRRILGLPRHLCFPLISVQQYIHPLISNFPNAQFQQNITTTTRASKKHNSKSADTQHTTASTHTYSTTHKSDNHKSIMHGSQNEHTQPHTIPTTHAYNNIRTTPATPKSNKLQPQYSITSTVDSYTDISFSQLNKRLQQKFRNTRLVLHVFYEPISL